MSRVAAADSFNGDSVGEVVNHLLNFPETIAKLISPPETHESKGASSIIPVDILDTQKEYIFYMDVPGLSKSDIQVISPRRFLPCFMIDDIWVDQIKLYLYYANSVF